MLFDIMATSKKRLVAVIAVLIIVLAVILIFMDFFNKDAIHKGIKIDDINVSGLKIDEAKAMISDNINLKYHNGSFLLKYGKQEWRYNLEDISYQFFVDDSVTKAYSQGRSGDFFNRLYLTAQLVFKGQNINIDTSFDKTKLSNILKKIKKDLELKKQNASVIYHKGVIKINKQKTGRFMDIDINMKLIENQLGRKNFDDIYLQIDETQPEILFEDIKDIESVISQFYTKFNTADKNRSDNIRVACTRINGRILMPNEIFSMNEALGPRTVENGYKEAPVIIKNELIPGTGGGICQVTTTLYDAVLKARLEVIERTHHSMTLGYVKPGQDATIAEGSIDFKFQNNQDYPVCLIAEVNGNTINVRVLGKENEYKNTVKLSSEVIETIPPGDFEIKIDDTLKDNERVVAREPRNGVRAILYREIYNENGVLLDKEKISEDYYSPIKGLVKVNSNYYFNNYYNKGVSK